MYWCYPAIIVHLLLLFHNNNTFTGILSDYVKHRKILPTNIRTLAVRSYNPAVKRISEGCFSRKVHNPTATKMAPLAKNKTLNR